MHPAIGIDLAWSPRNPGLAAASVSDDAIRITHLAHVKTNEEVLAFVQQFADTPSPSPWTPDDHAPDRNAGLRESPPAAALKLHAGPYPGSTALLGKCNDGVPRGTEVVWELGERFGISEVGLPPARHSGKHVMEVFPAAAMAVLFDLKSPLPYKKKGGRTWETCRTGLTDLLTPSLRQPLRRRHLAGRLPSVSKANAARYSESARRETSRQAVFGDRAGLVCFRSGCPRCGPRLG